jgi:large subunit ribosomal protein L7/L12
MNIKLSSIIEELKNLTLIESIQLIEKLEEIFKFDNTLSVSSKDNIVTNLDIENELLKNKIKEENILFQIILNEVPADKKIAALKIVRNITGLGLKESKDIVDNVPKLLKENLNKEEVEKFKKDLEEIGAKVTIK